MAADNNVAAALVDGKHVGGGVVSTYTVIFCYSEPPSMWCDIVGAENAEAAMDVAWEVCRDGNGWEESDRPEDQLSDAMVLVGAPEVAPDNYWSWTAVREQLNGQRSPFLTNALAH